jgi:hypothetical protein
MKYPVTRFRSLAVALKEFEPFKRAAIGKVSGDAGRAEAVIAERATQKSHGDGAGQGSF